MMDSTTQSIEETGAPICYSVIQILYANQANRFISLPDCGLDPSTRAYEESTYHTQRWVTPFAHHDAIGVVLITKKEATHIHFVNFSQAAENNRMPILEQLQQLLTGPVRILEVGSGAGQHAVFFADRLPHVTWQPTDQGEYFPGLQDNLNRLAPANLLPPAYLDLAEPEWPTPFDCLYSANVIHIMAETHLPAMFRSEARQLIFYGPFKYEGKFTSESNANFDLWLRERNPLSGIRDIEALKALATQQGYRLTSDTAMPANNQFLVFDR